MAVLRRGFTVLIALSAALGVRAADDAVPALSHLQAHLAEDALSHLAAHPPGLPPEALLVPLGNGGDDVLKGLAPAEEAIMVEGLARQDLRQTVLRVAAAQAGGSRMAIIKLQAGTHAGQFSVADLRSDAARCLRVAFNVALGFDHLDLWSVVPGAEMVGDQQEHLPVFSLSVSRKDYLNAAARTNGRNGEIVDLLPGVRYSPIFARYAADALASGTVSPTALAYQPLSESWSRLVADAAGPEASGARAAQHEVRAIFNGPRDRNLVALTIDDGPHPLITPLILQVLEETGVHATFFVVGQMVEDFPELARMIARDGHELANHAYSNRRLSNLPDDEAWAEIAACGQLVERIVGEPMRFLRPPGGRCSPGGLATVGAQGYTVALWSRNTGDWRKPPAAQIVRNATEGLQAGDIILMHQGDMCSVEALPAIIARIRAMGMEPVTLAELADAGGVIADDPASISALVNGQLGEE